MSKNRPVNGSKIVPKLSVSLIRINPQCFNEPHNTADLIVYVKAASTSSVHTSNMSKQLIETVKSNGFSLFQQRLIFGDKSLQRSIINYIASIVEYKGKMSLYRLVI